MIKISSSENIFSKFKNFFNSTSDTQKNPEPKDEVVSNDVNSNITFDDKVEIIKPLDDNIETLKPLDYNVDDTREEEVSIQSNSEAEANVIPTDDNSISIKSNNDTACLKLLDNSYTITQSRRVLLKVEKNKFKYPLLKTSDLFVNLNFPVVESVQVTQATRTETYDLPIGCTNNLESASVNFTDVSLKLFVSYSVELYNNTPDKLISGGCIDIRNIDIYSFEKDTFFAAPFDICFTKQVPNFEPNDFLINLTTTTPVVSPVCEFSDYYLYEVDVDIEITLSPIVIVDPNDTVTLTALNTLLGKPDLSNNKFTRGELEAITELDLSDDPNLDFTIFLYLVNLKKLNISRIAYDYYKLTYLENLISLEILIAEDNYFTDYTSIGKITSLKELYLDNDIITTSANTLAILDGNDITPLTNLINLIILALNNNNISTIPASISNLISLITLYINDNNVSDVSNLSTVKTLENLFMKDNPIDPNTTEGLTIVTLDLSNTNLDNTKLAEIVIPPSLKYLYLDSNNISDLSILNQYTLELISALNQTINYDGPIESIDSSYFLEVTFLIDTNYSSPSITFVSNDGEYYYGESCDCDIVIWRNITEPTDAYFEFSNSNGTFTGKVNVSIIPSTLN